MAYSERVRDGKEYEIFLIGLGIIFRDLVKKTDLAPGLNRTPWTANDDGTRWTSIVFADEAGDGKGMIIIGSSNDKLPFLVSEKFHHGIYVLPDSRERGIAKYLLTDAIAMLEEDYVTAQMDSQDLELYLIEDKLTIPAVPRFQKMRTGMQKLFVEVGYIPSLYLNDVWLKFIGDPELVRKRLQR